MGDAPAIVVGGIISPSGLQLHFKAVGCPIWLDIELRLQMLRWVTIEKFSAESGYTPDAVRSKIKRGDWLEGQVWIRDNPTDFEKTRLSLGARSLQDGLAVNQLRRLF